MSPRSVLQPGVEAPLFCLPSAADKEVCLKEYRGSWVVLFFYVKDGTSGCATEALDFSERTAEFEALGTVVFGVSPDSTAAHRRFIEKRGISVPLLSDPGHEVLEAYGAWGRKKMSGREYDGVLRSTVLIDPEGLVRHLWPKVKVKGHAAEVLEVLKGYHSGGAV